MTNNGQKSNRMHGANPFGLNAREFMARVCPVRIGQIINLLTQTLATDFGRWIVYKTQHTQTHRWQADEPLIINKIINFN